MNRTVADQNPVAERYLYALENALSPMKAQDRQEVVDEIRDHLQDATAAGKPLDEILSRLGPAESLAKAYLVDSLLNPRPIGWGWIPRTFSLLGLVAFGSLPTSVILAVLGPIGFLFTLVSPLVFASGLLGILGFNLGTNIQTNLEHVQAIFMGPALAVIGSICLWILFSYLKWATNLLRRVAAGR